MDDDQKKELKRAFKAKERVSAQQAMILDPEQLGDLLDYIEVEEPRVGCDHTLRLTRAWAENNEIDGDALVTSLANFGGYCDCEVLGNVDPDDIY